MHPRVSSAGTPQFSCGCWTSGPKVVLFVRFPSSPLVCVSPRYNSYTIWKLAVRERQFASNSSKASKLTVFIEHITCDVPVILLNDRIE
jgi:hypothetical protein